MAISKEKMNLMSKPHTDLLLDVNELNALTATYQKAFEDLIKAVQTAQDEKELAKKNYSEFLDQGDANKMQAALDRIRKANKRIDELTAEMKSFQSKVMELRKAQAALVEKSRELREKANIALKEARERQAAMETLDDACLVAASNINNLELVISKTTAKKNMLL
jgi:predicted RNase H-like nuclease (RuvC/YqgF family)